MRRVAWMLLALTACGGDGVAVASLPVFGPDIQSWLAARVVSGRVELEAADRDSPPIRFAPDERPSELELRAFTRPLAELQLPRGSVPPPAMGSFPRPLPRGPVGLVASVDGEQVGAWRAGTLPALEGVEYGIGDPCARFVPEVAFLPHSRRVDWSVSIDPDTVLFGTGDTLRADTRLNLIRAGGPVLEVALEADELTPAPRGAFRDARGQLWLGDADGGLWLGTLSGATLSLTRKIGPTSHGVPFALDGDPEAPESQLFVATSSGTLARYEGGAWAPIDSLPVQDPGYLKTSVLWLGTNDVIWGNSSSAEVHRWRSLRDTQVFMVNQAAAGIISIVRIDAERIGVGQGGGLISTFDGERFTHLGRAGLALDIYAFAPLDRGFIYTGVFGYVGEWNADVGYCPVSETPVAGSSIRTMRPLGDRLFLVGDSPRGPGNTSYTLVRVDRP